MARNPTAAEPAAESPTTLSKRAKEVNENLWTFGDSVRLERGPIPEFVSGAFQKENPKWAEMPVPMQFYIYELVDEDPNDGRDGDWKQVSVHKDMKAAVKRADELSS